MHEAAHMTGDYADNSASQRDAAHLLLIPAVERVVAEQIDAGEVVDGQFRMGDVGCGPGGVTRDVAEAVLDVFEAKGQTLQHFSCDLLDHNGDNAEQAAQLIFALLDKRGVPNISVQAHCDSFLDPECDQVTSQWNANLVVSNEALHWTDPLWTKGCLPGHSNSHIIVEGLAITSLMRAFRNISSATAKNGVAVLQFGHKTLNGSHELTGQQLNQLWNLVGNILRESFPHKVDALSIPLFYPNLDQVISVLTRSGFSRKRSELTQHYRDLSEETSSDIVDFVRPWLTGSLVAARFSDAEIDDFFRKLKEGVEAFGVEEFRRDAWYNTLLVARKGKEAHVRHFEPDGQAGRSYEWFKKYAAEHGMRSVLDHLPNE